MTSNAGAADASRSPIGFSGGTGNPQALEDAVKRTFRPEFRNRLSRVILFRSMDEAMAARITHKKLRELCRLLRARKVELRITPEAEEHVRKAGITREYGAREIDRVISGQVKPLLAELLLFGRLKKGGSCTLDVREGKLIVR